MVKNLQCLKTPQICYLRHAEHYAKNRTSLRGLDHDTLFLDDPISNEITNNDTMSDDEVVPSYVYPRGTYSTT